ncbi:MAG: hypothetical protein GKS00_21910 [Alphaproteobacteria bacterium]|nr:hypothetical protein [Alphaproteobacteria bacterium]
MPRVEPLQPAFNAGEFGPRMIARADFAKYRNASRKFENLIALAQGGAMRRPGTRFVVPVKNESAKTRLLRFEFNTVQAYIIEAGNNYFRFCRNQGQIIVPDITASITNGTFDADITGWTNKSAGGGSIAHDGVNNRLSLTSNGSVAGHAEQEVNNAAAVDHVLSFRVYGAASDTVKVRVGTTTGGNEIIDDQVVGVGFHVTAFTATAANFFVQFLYDEKAKTVGIDDVALLDNGAVELVTPYTTDQLFDVRQAQSADTLYLCHSDHPVYKLLRLGHASWSLEEVEFQDGPYFEENLQDARTLTAAATGGAGINVTASTIEGINDNRGFLSTDIGRLVRIGDGTDVGYGIIVSVTSATVVKVDVRNGFPNTTPNHEWRLGAWSATTGYPAAVNFHEQRLCMANTTTDPDKYWMSQSGDFENFRIDSDKSGPGVEVQDDDALDYRISSDQVNAIQWMRSGTQFSIGTRGGEWIGRSDGPILTPTDVDTKQQTTIGSAFVAPVQVDNVVLFLQTGRRQLREFAFNFEADGFRSPDMTILSDHIFKSRVCEMAYAQAPDSLVACLREDGRLAMLTYKREQDVIGWGRWVIGGTFDGGVAIVESVAAIPGNNGGGQVRDSSERDEIWLQVKRTINGATKRYIEVLEEAFEGPDRNDFLTEAAYEAALLEAQKNAYYCDSCITYDGVPETVINDLDHLEGETVKILADGAVHADKTVSGGSVTLDAAASVVQIGLGFFHDMEPLKMDFGNPAGSAIAKDKRIREVAFVLHECGALKVGAGRDSIKAESLREVADPMDTAVPLFTGEFQAEIEGDYETDPRVILRGDDPTPFTVLAVVPDVAVAAG